MQIETEVCRSGVRRTEKTEETPGTTDGIPERESSSTSGGEPLAKFRIGRFGLSTAIHLFLIIPGAALILGYTSQKDTGTPAESTVISGRLIKATPRKVEPEEETASPTESEPIEPVESDDYDIEDPRMDPDLDPTPGVIGLETTSVSLRVGRLCKLTDLTDGGKPSPLPPPEPEPEPGPEPEPDPEPDPQPEGEGEPVTTPPEYAHNPSPEYPEAARRRGYEGRVLLRIKVSAEGKCASADIVESSGYSILDKAALAAITKWEFKPATVNGTPAEGEVEVPIRFKLTD